MSTKALREYLMKKPLHSFARLGVALLLSISSSPTFSQSVQPSKKASAFQKTDVSLLFEIEREFNTHRKGKSTTRTTPMTPKEIRISTVRNSLDWMILKKSSSNGIIGSLAGALTTAHPLGLLIGGVTGAYQGKSTRYEEAQGKLNKMEQDILISKDYEITSEEFRLASYAGTDLYEILSMTPPVEILIEDAPTPSETMITDAKIINDITLDITPSPTIVPEQISVAQTEKVQLPGCYGLTGNPSKSLSTIQRRQLSTKCFYSMY